MPLQTTLSQLLRTHSHVNWALADQAMLSGVNFLTGVLLARYLGIEEFGRFALIWIIIESVLSIQHALLISPMMSIGPKRPVNELSSYYCAVVTQQILFSATVFGAILVGTHFVSVLVPQWELKGFALPLACVALAAQWQEFLRRYFFTRNRQAVAFVNDAVRYISQLVLLLALFRYSAGSATSKMVFWVIAGTAVLSLYGVFLLEKIKWDTAYVKDVVVRHWKFSKWLLASVLMRFTTSNLGVIFTGALLGTAAVGALRAARGLMGISHVLFLGLENFVPVRTAQWYHSTGREALFRYLKRVSFFGGMVTTVLAFVAAIAPEFWLRVVFGDQYVEYDFVLQWYAVIYLVNFFAVPLSAGLRAMERTSYIFRVEVWLAVATLFFAYPLIKFFGLPGLLTGSLLMSFVTVSILVRGLVKPLP